MEAENNWKDAEQHYLNAGDWKGAINMYRAASMWEDAYRVSHHCCLPMYHIFLGLLCPNI